VTLQQADTDWFFSDGVWMVKEL